MATILEEFEADFDEGEEKEKEEDDDGNAKMEGSDDEDEDEGEEHQDKESLVKRLKQSDRMLSVKHLLRSDHLNHLLAELRSPEKLKARQAMGDESAHDTIVRCNAMTVDITDEIHALHLELTSQYSKRFPELVKLVPNALDYARTANAVRNQMDLTQVDLSDILPSSILMIVTISASSSDGKPLNDDELRSVTSLCDEMIALDNAKQEILEYIKQQMDSLCPNVTAVVGSDVAARLVGAAGGVVKLSKLPSSVVQVLGQRKDVLQGLSTASIKAHQGFIHLCDLVNRMPPSLRTRAVRLLAGKCTLAARVDSYKNNPDGSVGAKYREEIEKRLQKLQEPPPGRLPKPLPAPDDKPGKRRGGKRARAMKDKYALSEMAKQANRLKFGINDDEEFDPVGEDLGMLKSGGGRLRLAAKDGKTSKLLQRKKQAKQYSSGATSGLSSSLAFTPVQGLELQNPLAQTPKPDDKYFGTTTSFFHAPKRVRKL